MGWSAEDFYPRPPRGGRPLGVNPIVHDFGFLSTPSARRATKQIAAALEIPSISIHALREEGDGFSTADQETATIFLSTPSARRATPGGVPWSGARAISIHALREEGDPFFTKNRAHTEAFLSTPSARRATKKPLVCGILGVHFYPRPPRGGRLSDVLELKTAQLFLSTPSARRAT